MLRRHSRALLVAGAAGALLTAAATSAAPESAQNEKPSESTLLTAINFALTGSDRATFVFSNRAECVVTWSRPSAQAGIKAVENFYLNNIDASRIKFQPMKRESQFGVVEYFTKVELHGEAVIREDTFDPSTTPAIAGTDAELQLNTSETDRLARAWKYIYTHGCRSAKSSF